MTVTEAHAIAFMVEERIRVLLVARRYYRRRGAEWPVGRREADAELRALVRLVRAGRRAARGAEVAEAVSASSAYQRLGYHDAQAAYR